MERNFLGPSFGDKRFTQAGSSAASKPPGGKRASALVGLAGLSSPVS